MINQKLDFFISDEKNWKKLFLMGYLIIDVSKSHGIPPGNYHTFDLLKIPERQWAEYSREEVINKYRTYLYKLPFGRVLHHLKTIAQKHDVEKIVFVGDGNSQNDCRFVIKEWFEDKNHKVTELFPARKNIEAKQIGLF